MTRPSMESEGVMANDCVKRLTSMVNELEDPYKRFDQYVFELNDPELKERLLGDAYRKAIMINDITIAINSAIIANTKINGLYSRVRDIVNKALESGTKEVTIDATDKRYGGCTVSTEEAQAILDEMLDQKNDAETMVEFIYQSYNELLVPLFPHLFKPIEKTINDHCIKDEAFYVRKRAYELIYEPMSTSLRKLRSENEREWHYRIRKWLRNKGDVYTSDTLQTYVDAMYDAFIDGDDIKTSMIANNCYKSLTPAEYKWVKREVDVRYKKNQIDVYMIADQPRYCRDIMRFILRLIFAYEYVSGSNLSHYKAETEALIDSFDINHMKILCAIPETCIFTFPTDENSAFIHTITLDVVKHVIEYNQNWELDAAYMYWFWTHIQGEGYSPVNDQEGVLRDVPLSAPSPMNYFKQIFIPKLKRIASIMADKLIGADGILNNRNSAEIQSPWVYETFPKQTLNPSERNTYMNRLMDRIKADDIGTVRRFIVYIHDNVIFNIPRFVWKSFNAISGERRLMKVPIQFLPNNFTIFDEEYELETGILTALNSIYWKYGYIAETNGNPVQSKNEPYTIPYLNYRRKGGLCFSIGTSPVIFSAETYESFKLMWYPKYTNKTPYTFRLEPGVEKSMIKLSDQWLFKWSSAQYSFCTQSSGAILRTVDQRNMIPYIGAQCMLLPYKDYILKELLPLYLDADGCPFRKHEFNANPWLLTYADCIAGTYITTSRSLMNVLFNGTVKRLIRCKATFPYSNVIHTGFIDAAHFSWSNMKVPTDKTSNNWENVILPQYIFSESSNESEFRRSPGNKYETKHINISSMPKGKTIDITTYVCDINHTTRSTIPCNIAALAETANI